MYISSNPWTRFALWRGLKTTDWPNREPLLISFPLLLATDTWTSSLRQSYYFPSFSMLSCSFSCPVTTHIPQPNRKKRSTNGSRAGEEANDYWSWFCAQDSPSIEGKQLGEYILFDTFSFDSFSLSSLLWYKSTNRSRLSWVNMLDRRWNRWTISSEKSLLGAIYSNFQWGSFCM